MSGEGNAGPDPQGGRSSALKAGPSSLEQLQQKHSFYSLILLQVLQSHLKEVTLLKLHEQDNVWTFPHNPKQLHNPRGVQGAPGAHLPTVEVTQWNLRGEDRETEPP